MKPTPFIILLTSFLPMAAFAAASAGSKVITTFKSVPIPGALETAASPFQATVEADRLQTVLENGINFTVDVVNPGTAKIDLANPLDTLQVELADQNGQEIALPPSLPRHFKTTSHQKATEAFSLPYRIVSVILDGSPLSTQEIEQSTFLMAPQAHLRLALQISQVQARVQKATEAIKLTKIRPGTYRLLVKGRLAAGDASEAIQQGAMLESDSLVVHLADNAEADPGTAVGAGLTVLGDEDARQHTNLMLTRYDLGKVSATEESINHTFQVRNDDLKPVTISRLPTSCPCTSATVSIDGKEKTLPIILASGQIMQVHVSINSEALRFTNLDKYVWICVPDQAEPAATLEVKGLVRRGNE